MVLLHFDFLIFELHCDFMKKIIKKEFKENNHIYVLYASYTVVLFLTLNFDFIFFTFLIIF